MSEHLARQAPSTAWASRPAEPDTGARAVTSPLPAPAVSPDTDVAVRVRALLARGELDQARALFATLVEVHQRRALRLAYQYLRDRGEAEDAVQDAFVKAYRHMTSYHDAWPFGVWFTRILVNGCIDRQKARTRRGRWFTVNPLIPPTDLEGRKGASPTADPEAALLGRERWMRLTGAVRALAGRQREIFLLCHYCDWTPKEVGAVLGLSESTVRVHLFRAARRLRGLLGSRS